MPQFKALVGAALDESMGLVIAVNKLGFFEDDVGFVSICLSACRPPESPSLSV